MIHLFNIKNHNLVIILILTITFLIFLQVFDLQKLKQIKCAETMINIPKLNSPKWNRNKCSYVMNPTLNKVLIQNNIQNSNHSNLHFPCSYNLINKEINELNPDSSKLDRFFIINNADNITAKDLLWKFLVSHHGIKKASIIMPMTYLLYNKNDLSRFNTEFCSKKLYIMKKNIQRQEGLLITRDKQEIINGTKNGYVIAQELLQDPYTINGHKINMRVYILIICNNNNLNVFVHKNGFMYYTKTVFKINSIGKDENITTGYVDRTMYDKYPLSHEDFRKYLDSNRTFSKAEELVHLQNIKLSEVVFNRIYSLIKDVFLALIGNICSQNKLTNQISFQLFGADIAINDNLHPSLMEINKGPDMNSKDSKDGDIKYKVMEDTMKLIGAINNNNTDYIPVLQFEDGKIINF
jgi:hypothetical protein